MSAPLLATNDNRLAEPTRPLSEYVTVPAPKPVQPGRLPSAGRIKPVAFNPPRLRTAMREQERFEKRAVRQPAGSLPLLPLLLLLAAAIRTLQHISRPSSAGCPAIHPCLAAQYSCCRTTRVALVALALQGFLACALLITAFGAHLADAAEQGAPQHGGAAAPSVHQSRCAAAQKPPTSAAATCPTPLFRLPSLHASHSCHWRMQT